MSIITAAGMAKVLTAVTISLHPGAHQVPASYTVQRGDTLSTIAAHEYGGAADWPAVWWANRHQVANPNMIATGQQLRLPASGHVPRWMPKAALTAIRAAGSAPVASASAPPAQSPFAVQAAAPAPPSSGGANWAAVTAWESGGNWSTNTGNGFYADLQFTEQT
jgi:LysM repeat protein